MDPLGGPAQPSSPDVRRGFGESEEGDLAAVPAFLRSAGSLNPPDENASFGRGVSSAQLGDGDQAFALPGREEPLMVGGPQAGSLPLATISPRRLLQIVAVVAIAWGLFSFGRQVASASQASTHADELRNANASLELEVAALQREFTLIQEPRYVGLQARAYRLGTSKEVPFALQANAPPLAVDAPGSAAVRVGADRAGHGPLDTWLHVLFGAD